MKEYILCAAVWFDNKTVYPHQPTNIKSGLVVLGRRHHNAITTAFLLNDEKKINTACTNTQGFITNLDHFVNRKEAGKIAFEAKQIDKFTDCLMSEELY
ncbi:MAG: hypothetical protein ACTSQF_09045 [Candidatus Heimdallarchaeaceae archaeon]